MSQPTKEENQKRQFVCVLCPKGCVIAVEVPEGAAEQDFDRLELTGHQCKHGVEYARQELAEPLRVLTTTVRVKGIEKMLSVRSSQPLPLARLFEVVETLDNCLVQPPIACGQVIHRNILGLGIDIIATWSIPSESDKNSNG
jgi:CxxC motif-containing protein